jgi:hypothetical protein
MRAHLTKLLKEVYALVHDAGLGEYGYMNPDASAAMTKINAEIKALEARPTIVCLIGSSRFYEAFKLVNYDETMAGRIVLSIGFHPGPLHGEGVGTTPVTKEQLDQLHMRKIELADEVFVVNVGGYVGESTLRELQHARSLSKRLRWLERDHAHAALGRAEDLAMLQR